MQAHDFAALTFAEAAPLWLASRTRISANTERDYRNNFRRLMPYFGLPRSPSSN
jgi:hypothetical protein